MMTNGILLFIFALLVCNSAGSLACGLAGSLALAAATLAYCLI